jgi:integrase
MMNKPTRSFRFFFLPVQPIRFYTNLVTLTFEIVVGTGRRISAVCSLRMEDLELDPTERTPWGAIVWPEDTDKMAKRVSERGRSGPPHRLQ